MGLDEVDGDKPLRVLRGGGWFAAGRNCRSAFRLWCGADDSDNGTGLRIT